MSYENWKQHYLKLDKELDEFKGNKKERHEKFGDRIDRLYNILLHNRLELAQHFIKS